MPGNLQHKSQVVKGEEIAAGIDTIYIEFMPEAPLTMDIQYEFIYIKGLHLKIMLPEMVNDTGINPVQLVIEESNTHAIPRYILASWIYIFIPGPNL